MEWFTPSSLRGQSPWLLCSCLSIAALDIIMQGSTKCPREYSYLPTLLFCSSNLGLLWWLESTTLFGILLLFSHYWSAHRRNPNEARGKSNFRFDGNFTMCFGWGLLFPPSLGSRTCNSLECSVSWTRNMYFPSRSLELMVKGKKKIPWFPHLSSS